MRRNTPSKPKTKWMRAYPRAEKTDDDAEIRFASMHPLPHPSNLVKFDSIQFRDISRFRFFDFCLYGLARQKWGSIVDFMILWFASARQVGVCNYGCGLRADCATLSRFSELFRESRSHRWAIDEPLDEAIWNSAVWLIISKNKFESKKRKPFKN